MSVYLNDWAYTTCGECGIQFAILRAVWNARADREGATATCPNGHPRPLTNIPSEERNILAKKEAQIAELKKEIEEAKQTNAAELGRLKQTLTLAQALVGSVEVGEEVATLIRLKKLLDPTEAG